MAAVRGLMLAAMLALLTAARHPPAPVPEAAPAVAPTIKAGVEKWRAGDYAAAVAIWQPFAAAGDADALFNLGQAYKLGRGVEADAAIARDYYRKAAVKGHLPAQANLGIALFQAGEKPEAIKWLKTAADRGEARAQYVLGIAAFNGDGMPRSKSLGYGYLLRAQASGLPQAITALGTIAPGLSPTDRSAGEAIAASLAAGTGVPTALAAASSSRDLSSPPPVRTASLPSATPPPSAEMRPPVVTAPAAPASTVTPRPAVAAIPVDRTLPPAPKPAPANPIAQPSPAQADATAMRAVHREESSGIPAISAPSPASAIATVAIPPSRATDPLAPRPRVTPPEVAHAEWPPKDAVPLKPFETVVAPPRKADGWRVQLGAFSSRKLADAAWASVKEAASPAKPLFAVDGPVTKLQMGPFPTHDAAKAACTKLTAAGRACFVTQG
jgi:cell division septation protein DedD